MIDQRNRLLTALTAGALVLGLAGVAYAQAAGSLVSSALAEGAVGEQADGYLGIKGTASGGLRDEVDAINIKRRAAYTQLAAQRGVTVKDVAATVGCQTLATRVQPGRAYQLPDGVWRVKSAAPITLPAYCAG